MDPCRLACCERFTPTISALLQALVIDYLDLVGSLLSGLPAAHSAPFAVVHGFPAVLSPSGTCPRHSCLAPSKGPSHQDGGCGPALAACLVSLPTCLFSVIWFVCQKPLNYICF